jgi:hypothetical protein
MFALDGHYVSQGIISNMICVSEADAGHAMWHLYSAQRLRQLSVMQATTSEAYAQRERTCSLLVPRARWPADQETDSSHLAAGTTSSSTSSSSPPAR